MTAVLQPRTEFFNRHGGNEKALVLNGRVFFPSGAWMEAGSYGSLHEPDADPFERQKRVVFYWRKKFDLASQNHAQHWNEAKRGIAMSGGTTNLPLVREAHAKREECRKQLAQAEAKLERLKPAELVERELKAKEAERYAAEHRMAQSLELDRLK